MIQCSNCGVMVEDGSKFCGECGTKVMVPKDGADLSIGDKNVVAGDVIGHQNQYKITGNATIVNQTDETKKLLQCAVCGNPVLMVNAKHCQTCGRDVCEHHYDVATRQCVKCIEKQFDHRVKEYREALLGMFSDGIYETSERRSLDRLQRDLQMTREEANKIEFEVREELARKNVIIRDMLSPAEENVLESAENLMYGEGKAHEALAKCRSLYDRHPFDSRTLAVYYRALAEAYPDDAWKAVSNLNIAIESLWLAKYDIAMRRGDEIVANECIDELKSRWPDSVFVKCRRILFCCKLGSEKYLKLAKEIAQTLDNPATEYEKAWCLIAKGVLDGTFEHKVDYQYVKELKNTTPYVALVLSEGVYKGECDVEKCLADLKQKRDREEAERQAKDEAKRKADAERIRLAKELKIAADRKAAEEAKAIAARELRLEQERKQKAEREAEAKSEKERLRVKKEKEAHEAAIRRKQEEHARKVAKRKAAFAGFIRFMSLLVCGFVTYLAYDGGHWAVGTWMALATVGTFGAWVSPDKNGRTRSNPLLWIVMAISFGASYWFLCDGRWIVSSLLVLGIMAVWETD